MVYLYRYFFQERWRVTPIYFRDDQDFLNTYNMTEKFHKLPESGFYADGEGK